MQSPGPAGGAPRRGFSLMEAMLAMLVLAGIAGVSMRAAGLSAKAQLTASDNALAARLSESLLAEVVSRRYGTATVVTGAARAAYTDIQQYANLSESPRNHAGTVVVPASANWVQSVLLEYVLTSNVSTVSGSDTGLLRVTVTVTKNGVPRATRIAYRAKD